MAKTCELAPDLYLRPPKSAIPGARCEFRRIYRTAALMQVANANNAILALGILPAGHRLFSLFAESDALSTGSDVVFDIGILNSYYGSPVASAAVHGFDTGTVPALVSGSITLADGTAIVYGNILTGSTIMQSGGGRKDSLALDLYKNVSVDPFHDRIIAINITTEATTGAAGYFGIGYCIDID